QFERGEQRDTIRPGGGRDNGRGGDKIHRLPPCWCGRSAYQVRPPSTRIGSVLALTDKPSVDEVPRRTSCPSRLEASGKRRESGRELRKFPHRGGATAARMPAGGGRAEFRNPKGELLVPIAGRKEEPKTETKPATQPT